MIENKRILVTGAAGYIGKHVVEQLIADGVHVIAADIDLSGISDKAEKIEGSIFQGEENIYELLGKPDICLHLAWQDGFKHNSHAHMENLSKHYEFIKNMLAGGLKQIAVMGSMHEIGYWEGMIDEKTPTDPMSYYGVAKNSLRQATKYLCDEFGAKYQWIRAFYITGDDSKNHSVFSKLLEMDKKGEKEFPFTSGKNKYDFLDIQELALQIASVVEQEEILGIINCCSGKPISLGERAEQFIKENSLEIKLKYGVFPERTYDSPAIWGDNDKIQKILQKRD